VHAAGTNRDRHIELACLLPTCDHKSLGPVTCGQARAGAEPAGIRDICAGMVCGSLRSHAFQ
jgi:hypothetical protein